MTTKVYHYKALTSKLLFREKLTVMCNIEVFSQIDYDIISKLIDDGKIIMVSSILIFNKINMPQESKEFDAKVFSYNDFRQLFLLKKTSNNQFQLLIDLKNEAIDRELEKSKIIDKLQILTRSRQSLVNASADAQRQSSDAYMELITKYPEYECWHAQDANDEIIKLIQKL